MKKVFKYYFIVWGILFALFNILSFVPKSLDRNTNFWIGYVFITLTFVGQLVCGYFAFKGDDIKRTFYNISLVSTSSAGLFLSFVFGSIFIRIPVIPYWIGIVLCAVILGFNIIAVVKAYATADIISGIDDKIKNETLFIKSLTVDAEGLVVRAKSDNVKNVCRKVYEAVRYSDPMSNSALSSIESEITLKMLKFSEAIEEDNSDKAMFIADEICILLNDRNKKCKLMK